MHPPITLTVSPARTQDGRQAYTTRGQIWDGDVEGRRVAARSTTPLCDAARALLAEGVDPATPIVMRQAGADHDALRSIVGKAAGLTVSESGGRPRFAKWRPNDWTASKTYSAIPPMRETELAAP
jgi:hypothetical protein